MKIGIMQPYFFPYLGYFQLISAGDKMLLYDHVRFIKKGWVNRNRILEINKGPIYLTLPVKNASSNKNICEILLDNSNSWPTKISNLIYYNYKRARYFDEIYPLLVQLFSSGYKLLTEFNHDSINTICGFLEMQPVVDLDIDWVDELEENLANRNSPLRKKYAEEFDSYDIKSIRVIEICKKMNAETYINPMGGQEIYDKIFFNKNDLYLYFLHTLPYKYYQILPEFYPDLSIIDVLMNNGREGTKTLLRKYELI